MSEGSTLMDDLTPNPTRDENGLPICSQGDCPAFDGKRCRLIGFHPDRFCEPILIAEYDRRSPAPEDREDSVLRDFAEHGTGFDLNPTVAWDDDESLARAYLNYIKRMDEAVRERARSAIDAAMGEKK